MTCLNKDNEDMAFRPSAERWEPVGQDVVFCRPNRIARQLIRTSESLPKNLCSS